MIASLEGACGACGAGAVLGAGREDEAGGGRGAFAGVSIGDGHAAPEGDWLGMECWDEPPSDVAGEIDAAGSDTDCGFTNLSSSVKCLLFTVFKKAAFRA